MINSVQNYQVTNKSYTNHNKKIDTQSFGSTFNFKVVGEAVLKVQDLKHDPLYAGYPRMILDGLKEFGEKLAKDGKDDICNFKITAISPCNHSDNLNYVTGRYSITREGHTYEANSGTSLLITDRQLHTYQLANEHADLSAKVEKAAKNAKQNDDAVNELLGQ